jgi:hypothetical protein
MRAGALAGIITREQATQANIMALALGHPENIALEGAPPC